MCAVLQSLPMCCDILRFESLVTPIVLTEDTNRRSAYPMQKTDDNEPWTNILFENTVMTSVLLSFG